LRRTTRGRFLALDEGARSKGERGLAQAAPKRREGAGFVGFVRLLRLVVLIVSGLSCNGCLYGRIVYFNSPSLAAPSYFDNRTVKAPTPPESLAMASRVASRS